MLHLLRSRPDTTLTFPPLPPTSTPRQSKKRKTESTLEANRAVFSADENATIDVLLGCGQEHLFAGWPAPGEKDDDKKRILACLDRAQQLIDDARSLIGKS